MGTSLKDGVHTGLIPKAMNALFSRIETLKHEIEFQLNVSFIEVRYITFSFYPLFRLSYVYMVCLSCMILVQVHVVFMYKTVTFVPFLCLIYIK